MAQLTIFDIVEHGERLGVTHEAGPAGATTVSRVDVVPLNRLSTVPAGTLAIVPGEDTPAPYLLDIALRQASARQLAGLIFTTTLVLPETAIALADRGGVPVLGAAGVPPADLAMSIDRLLAGGASEAMMRAADAIAAATAAATDPETSLDQIIEIASVALGAELELVPDTTTSWSESDAVCIGEVPIGRLVTRNADSATSVALPVIASLLSRAAQRRMRDRYAGSQSRADLLIELVLAESSRVEAFVGQAARLGFPLQQSHVVAWLKPTSVSEPDAAAPRSVHPALELFALQLVDGRDETWHVAFLQDDLILVSTEEHGAADHQRRLRDVGAQIQEHARTLAGAGWEYTLGLGTPQIGAVGLRLSAAESRIAAESAIASGRPGGVELTDVTGLRRVLLDFFASPISRKLLTDILQPLDELGPDRAHTAVRTLLSYLAHRNSLANAGKELHLHPNAVGYRLKRIRETLQLDLDDPDTRFAVELACRVRLLGAGER
jgi:sugar diacid utilization regulator